MQLPALKNLLGQQCHFVVPWEYKRTCDPPKDSWKKSSSLDHCFFSGYHGVCSEMRISKENPPAFMYALVLDFDTNRGFRDQQFLEAVEVAGDIKPAYIGHTKNNGARVVFLLEEPMPLINIPLTRLIQKHFSKKLKADRLFPGLCQSSLDNVTEYFEVGDRWEQVSNSRIPRKIAMQWAIEATRSYNWKKHDVVIPFDKVHEEVEKRWPGRWTGSFEKNKRGVRFWDDEAKNDTSAVVCESGMRCFSGPHGFMSWRDIFGNKFVAQYVADKIGGSTTDVWFDSKEYWLKRVDGIWGAFNRMDMCLHLKVACGLAGTAGKGENQSDVETALHHLQHHQSVECAAPLVHRPEGIVHTQAGRVLNTSKLRALTPSESPLVVPEEHFPFIAEFLGELFTKQDTVDQLSVFLAWLKRFYEGAHKLRLTNGHVLYLVGPTGRGKTLLSTVLISGLVGGHVDASPYLTGMDDWNSHLFESAVWSIDDVVALKDSRAHERFSALLKKIAANTCFTISEKYRKARQVEWNGRVVVTCNDDPESSRILPDLDMSNRDKVILLKVAPHTLRFPEDTALRIRLELPLFARWLLNWKIPEELLGESRYGIKEYAESSLIDLTRFASRGYGYFEMLQVFFKDWTSDNPWEGTSTDLYTEMIAEDGGLADIARRYTHIEFGRQLGKLMSSGYPISCCRTRHGRVWRINSRFFSRSADKLREEKGKNNE